MQKISELLNITVTVGNPLTIYHPIFKDDIIYCETSNGYWYKQEYDSNGDIIYCEDSKGYWFKQEYDSNGKEIYFENSNGIIKDNRVKELELTLKQIAEKFGISVSQLKIKK